MTEQKDNPLVAALPPETDYLTYLTIVEYNLSKDQLLLFHDLLQDTQLTTNIGWDLVHLLLPLLPESEKCLQDVATLGNPRETVLKVAECLENLGHPNSSDAEEDPLEEDEDDTQNDKLRHQNTSTDNVDLLALQFQSLSHMLCVLHPRIKTKHPSRFLATSLKSVLQAYRYLHSNGSVDGTTKRLQSTIRAILMIAKSMSGSKRPHLPPRRTQEAVPQVNMGDTAPDPEGQGEDIAAGEKVQQLQILRSFVIQALELYIQSLEPIASIDSALAWSSRYHDRTNRVPGKPSFFKEHGVEEELERADATVHQLLSSLEGDLQLSWKDILKHILDEDGTETHSELTFATLDFPVSKSALLCALAAKAAISLQNNRPLPFDLSIFPEHSQLTEIFSADIDNDIDVDALVILGRAALDSHGLGEWETRAEFNQYLQRLVELAANANRPNLSSQASELTSIILHSHPSSDARSDFIQDTLESCPYPEFKEAAILWLKDEILAAFGLSKLPLFPAQKEEQTATFGETSNVFTHAETLKNAGAIIFAKPDTSQIGETSPSTVTRFWLAALNLWYLLRVNESLHEALQVDALEVELSINRDFVGVLQDLVKQSEDATNPKLDDGFRAYLPLIDDALGRL